MISICFVDASGPKTNLCFPGCATPGNSEEDPHQGILIPPNKSFNPRPVTFHLT